MDSIKVNLTLVLIYLSALGCSLSERDLRAGFQYLQLQDTSRSYNSKARPVNLFVWYPTQKRTTSMKYGRYYDLDQSRVPQTENQNIDSIRFPFLKLLVENKLNPESLTLFLEQRVEVGENAPFASDEYPLVIYFPGGGRTGYTHSFLCSELARNGFVVVGISSLGIDQIRNPGGLAGLELELEDMKFAIDAIRKKFLIKDRIGFLSFTQRSNASQILLKMKYHLGDAFVAIDPNPGYRILEEAEYYVADKMNSPSLNIFSNHLDRVRSNPDVEKLQATPFPGDVESLVMMNLNHTDLTDIGWLGAMVSSEIFSYPTNPDSVVKDLKEVHHSTIMFFDKHLK